MNHYITFLLLALTSFFTLINPLGVMPIFLSMTADFDIQNKKRTARKAVTLSFIIATFTELALTSPELL